MRFVRREAPTFGTPRLIVVDVPKTLLATMTMREVPDEDDEEGWEFLVDMMSWPGGIGLTPEEMSQVTQVGEIGLDDEG
jgi:hypothetical protein